MTMNRAERSEESGFTLIELLTVIATIGVLASIMLSGFSLYRASAAYAVATSTLQSARNAVEASMSVPDTLPAAVGFTELDAQGAVPVALRDLMPGMQMPKDVKLSISYDPACFDPACTETILSARHCKGMEYITWQRFGDGLEIMLEHIDGAGC